MESTGQDRKLRVIGVLDVARGRAVHARSGRREQYVPVSRVAGVDIADASPSDVARVYVERIGLSELYMADLDAIQGGATQHGVIAQVSGIGVPLMVDAGVRSVDDGRSILEAGASGVVVGLETLPAFAVLDELASALGGEAVAFSLDLKSGTPVSAQSFPESERNMSAASMASRAAAAGFGTVILIDMMRIGGDRGVDLNRVREIRAAVPGMHLVAGGGIRNPGDLDDLRVIGCDGALVATALHSGVIGRADIRRRS